MDVDDARALVAGMANARQRWLDATVARTRASALWLIGSLAHGRGDEWSDLDLVVVGGEPDLTDAVLTLDVAGNGPVGGRYVGAIYPAGELPLWVDWYQWPPGTPVPSGARLLTGAGEPGDLPLFAALDRIGRCAGPDPDPDTVALAMVPLAAKKLARGDLAGAERMADLLAAPPAPTPLGRLVALLGCAGGDPAARALVARVLDVVAALPG